jgi:hypothetical protein
LAIVCAVFVVIHVVNVATADQDFLRINEEQNVWTWLISLVFAAAAASAWAFGALQQPGARWPWTTVGGVMLLLSADEVAMFHERIETDVSEDLSLLLLQPLLALAALALFIRLMRALEREARRLVGLAAAALVLAQAGSTVDSETEEPAGIDAVHDVVEEVLEVSVPTFVLAATLPLVWPRLKDALRPG